MDMTASETGKNRHIGTTYTILGSRYGTVLLTNQANPEFYPQAVGESSLVTIIADDDEDHNLTRSHKI